MDDEERTRRRRRRDAVLDALTSAGDRGLANYELERYGGLEATRRVRELRAAGCAIDVVREHGGVYRYTLRALPDCWKPFAAEPELPPTPIREDDGMQPSLFE